MSQQLFAVLLDLCLVVIAALFCVIGYWRGLFHSVFNLVGFAFAVFFGKLFAPDLGEYYFQWLFLSDRSVSWKYPASIAIAFLTAFIASILAIWIVKMIVTLIIRIEPLRFLDKMLGLLFGLCLAFLFCEVIAFGLDATYPYLQSLAPELFTDGLPEKTFILRFLRDYNLISYLLKDVLLFN